MPESKQVNEELNNGKKNVVGSTVYLMDCVEGMKQYPDKYFDLAIVDPPYGIGEDGRKTKGREGFVKQKNGNKLFQKAKDYKHGGWDNEIPTKEYFDELHRVSKCSIIFGANYFYLPQFKPPRRNEFDKFVQENKMQWILWDKINGENDFNDCELAQCYGWEMETIIFPLMWAGFSQAKSLKEPTTQQGNKKLNEKRIHPTQKPVLLYQWLFDHFSQPEDKILDTHLGSQSSRIAANKAGLDFTGFEIDKDYFEAGCKRYEQYKSQLRIEGW